MARARWQVRQSVGANVRDLLAGQVARVFGNEIGLAEGAHLSDGELVDSEMYVYAGAGAGQSRRVASHVQNRQDGVALLIPSTAWNPAVDDTSRVEVHLVQFDFTVAKYNEAILQAHKAAEDLYLVDVVDETVTAQVGRNHYPIPPGFRGLHSVEYDWPADVGVPGSVRDAGALNWGSQFYDQDRRLFDTSAQARLAQGFYVTSGGQPQGFWCGMVALYLRRIGNPLGPTGAPAQLTLSMVRDAGGLPTGPAVDPAYSVGTRSSADVDTTYSFVQFRFPAPIFIPSDYKSHLILSTDRASADAANYVAWGEDTATAYNRGAATRYDGSSWSVIPNSALIFTVQTSEINQLYRSIPRDDASGPCRRVVESGTAGGSLLWLREPSEGARLRLRGQGQAAAPALDTDPVLVPEAFIVPKATALLLAMAGAGPTTDSDNRDRWALYHSNLAERELPRLRTQWMPNSETVTPR